jgi:hypothetical protein
MRAICPLAMIGLLLGCGNGGASETVDDGTVPTETPGSGGVASGEDGTGGQAQGGAESDVPWDGELAEAIQIAPGEASLLGITSDGWAVFRDADALRAVATDSDSEAQEVSATPGNVLIRGKVVFNWANVDWEAGVGDLSVWSAEGGAHEVGPTPYSEGLVAASASGASVVFTANASETTTDLMITNADFSSTEVLIPALGLGSETTCAASIGFVGDRLFVGYCSEGSRAARIERFELVDGTWEPTLIAEDALPAWSADESGELVFYQSSQYSAYVSEGGDATLIDTGVGRGQIVSDGSAVLYTVGDQLRRSEYPEVNPVPVVTTGYKQPVGFSSSFDLALYSTNVTYEEGTRQDLFMVRTFGFNTEPIELVGEPVAALGRSQMTADGKHVFFLTDMSSSGATLNVVANDGSEMLALPNVTEVVAANASTLVFTDNASDPQQYPNVADLKVLNLAHELAPRLVEEKILNPRGFYLDASRDHVVFVRSGLDRDPELAMSKGVFVREIH